MIRILVVVCMAVSGDSPSLEYDMTYLHLTESYSCRLSSLARPIHLLRQ